MIIKDGKRLTRLEKKLLAQPKRRQKANSESEQPPMQDSLQEPVLAPASAEIEAPIPKPIVNIVQSTPDGASQLQILPAQIQVQQQLPQKQASQIAPQIALPVLQQQRSLPAQQMAQTSPHQINPIFAGLGFILIGISSIWGGNIRQWYSSSYQDEIVKPPTQAVSAPAPSQLPITQASKPVIPKPLARFTELDEIISKKTDSGGVSYFDALRMRAKLLQEQGRLKESISDYISAGDIMLAKKEYSSAVIPYKKAVSLGVNCPEGLERLGECYFHLKKFIFESKSNSKDNPYWTEENIDNANPKDPTLLRAFALFMEDRYDEARAESTKNLEVEYVKGDLHVVAGLANIYLGNYRASIPLFSTAIERYGEQNIWGCVFKPVVPICMRGIGYYNTGQVALAKKDLEKARRIIPDLTLEAFHGLDSTGVTIPLELIPHYLR